MISRNDAREVFKTALDMDVTILMGVLAILVAVAVASAVYYVRLTVHLHLDLACTLLLLYAASRPFAETRAVPLAVPRLDRSLG